MFGGVNMNKINREGLGIDGLNTLKKSPKAPCNRCAYKRGLILTFIDPCPMCMMNGYKNFVDYREILREGIKEMIKK